jgi:hypothetical protein
LAGCAKAGLPRLASGSGPGKVNVMSGTINLRHISLRDLAMLGVQDLAFIKRVAVDDEVAYSIHAADGTQMALMADREIAFAAVRQHGLEPVSVH